MDNPAPLQFGTYNREMDTSLQRAIDAAHAKRVLAKDDAGRAAAGTVAMVALASFTMVLDDEDGHSYERVVHAGDEFEISQYDLPRYQGRGRLKSLDAPPGTQRV